MSFLEEWNAMPVERAATEVLPCGGSHAWAWALVARRPLSTLPELLAASDAAWWSLDTADWQEAFDTHPRIGERHAPSPASTPPPAWSASEQGGVANASADVRERLAAGNRAYEQRFGRTFIVCATGKDAKEMLAILEQRMRHTPEEELREAAEQQREITHLRLRKWLSEREVQHGA